MRTILLPLVLLSCRAEVPDDSVKDHDDDAEMTDVDGDGFSTEEGDCDDNDASVLPGAAEVCDGIDNDCDGELDEGLTSTWYRDADGDGFGDLSTGTDACEPPAGAYVSDATDCDDTRADVYPGADEACDGVDNDCDGSIDEDGTSTYYADADGDGYGDLSAWVATCSAPGAGYVSDGSDCDDTRADAYPGRPEVCDEIDNDCDGEVDEGVTDTFYEDRDGDGYGTEAATDEGCIPLTGYAPLSGDCDDEDAAYNPGIVEVCTEPEDYNCDGSVGYADDDGDGFAACEECDDSDAAVNPGAPEVCNEIDDDCDGAIDDDDSSLDTRSGGTWYVDADGDGYGDGSLSTDSCDAPAGSVATPGDCDDADPAVSPGAVEVCNEIDDDCDGDIDDDDSDLDPATGSAWYADDDGDGYGDAATLALSCDGATGDVPDDSDCDDTDFDVNPAATEVCNTIDDDCDGAVDDDDDSVDASTATDWYADTDGDGYGDAGSTTLACAAPAGAVADATDCDDTDIDVNPAATEACNGYDDDCDGDTDDDDASLDTTTAGNWYSDADSDGYGDAASATVACTPPSGTVADSTDCDDTVAAVNPGATEACNGYDDDCDGDIDDDDASLDASTTTAWYTDGDGDGYGGGTSVSACDAPAGYIADGTDCDDANASVNPAATETCDGTDQDCDGTIDDGVTTVSYSSSTYGGSSCSGAYDYTVTISACGCSDVAITGAFYDASDGSGGQVVSASVTPSSSMSLTWDDCTSGCDCDLDTSATTSWSVSKSGTTLTVAVSNTITGYDAGNTVYAGYSITSYGTYYDHRSSSSNTFTYACSY